MKVTSEGRNGKKNNHFVPAMGLQVRKFYKRSDSRGEDEKSSV